MLRIVLLSIGILTASLLRAQTPQQAEAEKLLTEAEAYFLEANDLDAASVRLQRVMELDATRFKAPLYLGWIKLLREDYAAAMPLLDKALALDTQKEQEYLVRFLKGTTFFNQKQYPEAIDELTRSLALQPDNSEAYHTRAMSYMQQGQYLKALPDLNTAIAADPASAALYFDRGLTYHAMGMYGEALSDFEKCLQTDPAFVRCYYYMGSCYMAMEQYERAASNFELSLRKADHSEEYTYALLRSGIAYIHLKNYGEATRRLNQVIERAPGQPAPYSYLGFISVAQGKEDEARSWFQKALDKDPAYDEALYHLGLLNYEKDPLKGLAQLEAAGRSAAAGGHTDLLSRLANSYIELKDTLKALETLDLLLEKAPADVYALKRRIEISTYYRPRYDVQILDDFNTLIEIHQKPAAQAYYMVGKALYLADSGYLKDAEELVGEAIETDPSNPEFLAIRAQLKLFLLQEKLRKDNRSSATAEEQQLVLSDIDLLLRYVHRQADAYLLKTTVLMVFGRHKEACEAAGEAVKQGGHIEKPVLQYICKGKEPADKSMRWSFFYELSKP